MKEGGSIIGMRWTWPLVLALGLGKDD